MAPLPQPLYSGPAGRKHSRAVVRLSYPLVLASASPRRATLLASAGIEPTVAPVDCDETPRPGEQAVPYARRIADAKLAAALVAHVPARDGAAVLVADTVVWRDDGAAIGKPRDRANALAIITALTSGDPHNVTTAWALARPDGTTVRHSETTRVFMRTLSPAEREAYLTTDQWRDKAGGYGIQAAAASFVTRIEGSYTNVVGLPLAQVVAALTTASAGDNP